MKRIGITGALCLLALPFLGGCAGYVAIEVDTEPRGASVFRQDTDEFLGRTPTGVLHLQTSKKSVPITLRMLNFKPKTVLVPSQVTFATPKEAEEHLTSYRFMLNPRY